MRERGVSSRYLSRVGGDIHRDFPSFSCAYSQGEEMPFIFQSVLLRCENNDFSRPRFNLIHVLRAESILREIFQKRFEKFDGLASPEPLRPPGL